MKPVSDEAVQRTMQVYEGSALTEADFAPIKQVIDRHVQSAQVGAFLTALLQLTIEQNGGWHTRKEIGAKAGIEPDRCTGNLWAHNEVLLEQFKVHRNRISEHLGGRVLELRLRSGNPQRYCLESVDASEEEVPYVLAGSAIRYRLSDEPTRLSWWGKITHPGVGTSREQYRKWLFVTPFILLMLLALGWIAAAGMTSLGTLFGAPFRPFDYLATFSFGAIILYLVWKRWGRLFDDRVLLLDLNDLAGSTGGVVLDRARLEDRSFMVLRRYVAPCPICSATVRLASGEPDFKRRIVGRCEESPREHVYSFDRVTLEGGFLVQRLATTLA